MRTARRIASAALGVLALAGPCSDAFAYRPFDGTDAAVAAPGEAEIELGPAGLRHAGSEHVVVAPAVALNYGLNAGWEAVLDGAVEHGLSSGDRGWHLVGTGAFLKGVLREGSLQEKVGPSLATEFGVLPPGIGAEPGMGASVAGILSQRWRMLTAHLNLVGTVTREGHGDLFIGAILEGPDDWAVRPVVEAFYERDFGQSRIRSGLVGAIWRVSDDLAIDVGLRGARENDRTVTEIRAGFTFRFEPR